MAATVEFSESNGLAGAEVVTDGITNINFGTSDSPNIVPASHPIIISGYSYAKWIRFHVTAMGGSSQIDTLKFYKSSGAYVAGETIGSNMTGAFTLANSVITLYAHAVAANGGGAVVTPMTGLANAVLSADYDVFPVTAALPGAENLSIGGGAGGHLNAPGYSTYLFLGLKTTGATPAGPVNQKIFTIQWNET